MIFTNQGDTDMKRTLRIETLETRYAFCGPTAMDANADGYITPQDVLVAVNAANEGRPIADANCDGQGTPRDVLRIINYVNLIGSTTSQNVTIRHVGGVGQIPTGDIWPAWTVRVNASGHVEFDVALELETENGDITQRTPLNMLSVQGLPGWSVTSYSDPRLGTIYRVQGRVDGPFADPLAGLDVRLSLDTMGLEPGKIRGWVVYQNWSERFGQQLSNEVRLNDVTLFDRWWI